MRHLFLREAGNLEASREIGIPRISVVKTEVTPGGCETVANDPATLGVMQVSVLGVSGEDAYGGEMKALAIDIGGTKFTLASFDDRRLVRCES